MGTVYRKCSVKPPPADAVVSEKNGVRIAKWKSKGKTRTAPVNDAGRIVVKSAIWTAKYRDASGVCEVSTGCRDETAARKVLADLQRRAELVKVGLMSANEASAADHLHAPIATHINDYLRSLDGVNATHFANVTRHLNRVFTGCAFATLNDLDRTTLVAWLDSQGLGARTRNMHLAAASAFCNWLAHPDRKRIMENPFAKIAKADEKAGNRRKRRALTEAELVQLLSAAGTRPLNEALTIRRGRNKGQLLAKISPKVRVRLIRLGYERASIYKTLVLTGLRQNELATLTIGQLDFEAGLAQLNPGDEKNGEGNALPLRADLLADLLAWTENRPSDSRVFKVPAKLIKLLNLDLKLAGIAKRDSRGRTVDVHSLRHSFATHLSAGNVAPSTAQAAMRHSDLKLTMNTYTDPKLLAVREALNVLPALRLDAPTDAPNPAKACAFLPIRDKPGNVGGDRELDRRSSPFNAKALSQASCDKSLRVETKGIEPSTPGLQSRCSPN